MEQTAAQEPSREIKILQEILSVTGRMTGWLKFIGIVLIVYGAIYAITIVGIIFAWLPVWLGVILLQAASKADSAKVNRNAAELPLIMDKIRLFFVITGVVSIISIAMAIMMLIAIFSFGSFLGPMLENMSQY